MLAGVFRELVGRGVKGREHEVNRSLGSGLLRSSPMTLEKIFFVIFLPVKLD